jgi:hypothetical protein
MISPVSQAQAGRLLTAKELAQAELSIVSRAAGQESDAGKVIIGRL